VNNDEHPLAQLTVITANSLQPDHKGSFENPLSLHKCRHQSSPERDLLGRLDSEDEGTKIP
jgi:hypothetical protein